MYIYQRGEIYRLYPAGSTSAEISRPSPGVLIHADIDGLGALKAKAFSLNSELLLLP